MHGYLQNSWMNGLIIQLKNSQKLLDKKEFIHQDYQVEFENIANFCRGVGHNPLKP